MALSPAAIAAAILTLAAGLAVLVLRRLGPLTVALFALLVLWACGILASAGMTGAPDLASATLAARLSIWCTLPLPALLAFTGPAILGIARAPRALRWAQGALLALTLGGIIAYAMDHALFVARVAPSAVGYSISSGPLHYALAATVALSLGGLALGAALRTRSSEVSTAERERAAWVAVATGMGSAHAGAFFLAYIASAPPSLAITLFWARALPTLAAGALAALAFAMLGGAGGSTRRPLLAVGILAAILGLVDGLVAGQLVRNFTLLGYETNLILIRLGFAFLFSVAILRFGLADAGAAERRLAARVATLAVGILGGALVLGAAYLVLGRSTIALGVAALVGISAPLALREPTRRAGRAVAARLLLAPDDPRAIAERARTYASALAASRDGGSEGARFLADLRLDLGISEREHELMLEGLASREGERYHPVEVLGRGATAEVELARDTVAGQQVVIKRFKGLRDPAAVLREARALAAVRHPRIVPFLEVDRRGDEIYLVLAHAAGGSARRLLDAEGPIPPDRAVALTLDLLEGLAALHATGVVHCDVKPENLLLDGDGRGLLGDFGSARFSARDLVDTTLSGSAAEGSLSTISPEALRGAPPAPARDVYATGALLYRLLTGEHYVDLASATVFDARERITLDAPRLPHARVPPALEVVIRRALAKRAEDRYASAAEMRAALAGAR